MPLPKLASFDENIHKLHQTVMILGPITNVLLDKQPNWLHLALDILPFGVRTQQFPQGGQITVNFKARTMLYSRGSGSVVQYKLEEFNQKTLFETVLAALEKDELAGAFDTLEGDTRIEKIIRKIYTSKPDEVDKAIAEHSHIEPLVYDVEFGNEYSEVMYTFFTAFSRWRARLNGHLSPIVVWSEHFDISTLWFESADMDEYKAHINIGFAPFTEGTKFTRPYFYAYAYPYREKMTMPQPTKPLKWEMIVFQGIYADYDDIASQPHPENYIEQLCEKSFKQLKSVLKSDDTDTTTSDDATNSEETSEETASPQDSTSETTAETSGKAEESQDSPSETTEETSDKETTTASETNEAEKSKD